jgi:hypothetical protein
MACHEVCCSRTSPLAGAAGPSWGLFPMVTHSTRHRMESWLRRLPMGSLPVRQREPCRRFGVPGPTPRLRLASVACKLLKEAVSQPWSWAPDVPETQRTWAVLFTRELPGLGILDRVFSARLQAGKPEVREPCLRERFHTTVGYQGDVLTGRGAPFSGA